jgi:hypothetical protein
VDRRAAERAMDKLIDETERELAAARPTAKRRSPTPTPSPRGATTPSTRSGSSRQACATTMQWSRSRVRGRVMAASGPRIMLAVGDRRIA